MQRKGIRVVTGAFLLLALIGTGVVAYSNGKTAGINSAASDRSSFGQARGTTVSGGQGAGASGFGGGQRTGGTGGTGGTGSAGGAGTTSSVMGKVTKTEGGTLTLQEQPNNIAVTVATDATTTVTTFAPGVLGDLKTGDIIALQGDKTGDTAFTAKTIFALSGFPGDGAAGQGSGGSGAPAGTAPAGSAASGGRGRATGNSNATGGAASAPAGREVARGCSPA